MGVLQNRIAAFTQSLSPEEANKLTVMERTALLAETDELLSKTRGSNTMSRTAQVAKIPPQDMQPQEEIQGQAAPPQTPVQAPPAPMPGVTADPEPDPSTPFQQYVEEKESQAPVSQTEMGLSNPTAAYVPIYKHLRIRATSEKNLEVFDPHNANKVLITVRPNTATKTSEANLRNCAVEILKTIASSGLTKTAQSFKAKVHTAQGIVDYGDNNFADVDSPDYTQDSSINSRGDSNLNKETSYDQNGVTSTTLAGDELTVPPVDQKQTRTSPGAEGGSLKTGQNSAMKPSSPPTEIAGGGSLAGRTTNMADENHDRNEHGLSATDMYDSNMRDDRKPYEKGTPSTEGEINTFANETLTAEYRQAQMESCPCGTPGCPGCEKGQQMKAQAPAPVPQAPAPQMPPVTSAPKGCPMHDKAPDPNCAACNGQQINSQAQGTPSPMPTMTASHRIAEPDPDSDPDPDMEEKVGRYIKAKVRKEVHDKTRSFIARFIRCVKMAAARQSLNLEPNQLKIAMADALMSPAFLSRHEEYVPMDARTATFVVEAGLNRKNAEAFIDSLIAGAAHFYKMSDQTLAQLDQDIQRQQPVEVTAEPDPEPDPAFTPTAEADPGAEVDEPTLVEEPKVASERRRASAVSGNLPINPGVVASPEPGNDKRSAVRSALGHTKGSLMHSAMSRVMSR